MIPVLGLSLTIWGLLIAALVIASAPIQARYGRKVSTYPLVWSAYGLLCLAFTPLLANDHWHALSLWSIALLVGLPLLLLVSAIYCGKHRHYLLSSVAALTALTLTATAVDAYFFEPYNLEVVQIDIPSIKVVEPIKIAVIADIQTDNVGQWEDDILEKTMAAKPDLILFLGDYIQCLTREERTRERSKLANLLRKHKVAAPQGCYALAGDVEAQDPSWDDIFSKTGIKPVKYTESAILLETAITALSFEESQNPHAAVVKEARFHIVCGHMPNFALNAPSGDLFIAGHTHGGQVQLPGLGPLIPSSVLPQSWSAGYDQAKGPQFIKPGKPLIVSRGLGMERGYAPRLRFFCRPQLLFITVKPIK